MYHKQLLVFFLVFSSNSLYAQMLRFFNASNQPIVIATAYTKDGSIAGLGNSGYTDPNPFAYTEGYFRIAARGYYDLPRRKTVRAYGKDMEANLTAVRILVVKGRDQAIVHPDRGMPEYYPIYKEPGMSNFTWTVHSAHQSGIESRVKQLAGDGHKVSLGMFYNIYNLENTNNGSKWTGVGASGSKAADVINSFWSSRLVKRGTVLNFRNASGKKYEFRISFMEPGGAWRVFTNTVDAQPNGTFKFTTGANQDIAQDSSGKYMIKAEGKDFDGNVVTWGPPLNSGSKVHSFDGTRQLILDMNLQ